MAITSIPPLDRTSPTFRSDVDTFFGTRVPNFVGEVNLLAANLNSIAAGGAYAIPYRFSGNAVSNGSAAGGVMAYGGGAQLLVDTKGADGKSAAGIFSAMAAGTSAIKGHIRIIKIGDPNKWVVYSINSYTPNSGGLYGILNVGLADHSSDYGFADGDAVLVYVQCTGDKGDKGDTGAATQLMVIRDQKASGAAPQNLVGGAWTKRTINTTVYSSITGAFVLGDEVQLPVGVYSIQGSAPAAAGALHQIRLFNVTDNALHDVGTSEALGAGQSSVTRSFLRTVLVVTGSAKKFRIDHWANLTVAGGAIAGGGSAEVYSEFLITKVS